MKFNFKNFGYIDEGSIELSDLTILCGPNNSGKTYTSYSIYGFLKYFRNLADFSISNDLLDRLREEGSLDIDLEGYTKETKHYIKKASEKFSNTLDDYFSVPEEVFAKSEIEFSINDLDIDLSKEFKRVAKFGNSRSLIFDKPPSENCLSIVLETTDKELSKLPKRILSRIISDAISDCLLSGAIVKPFVITSERTGIALFYKELDVNKNRIIEHLTESDDLDPFSLLESMRSRYAKPIQDNISVIRDYETINKQKSFIKRDKQYKYVTDALQDLLGGSFKPVDKQVVYQPKKIRNRDRVSVPVYIASSSIKSLFLIDLYINCLAKEKGLLIIDEPELNLHPDNQRKMAGLLARLVNAGIKVMITTHSDYLIREINNRIMLSNEFSDKNSIMIKQKSPKLIKEDILQPEQVKAYTMSENTIKEINVDKYGIKLEIFDSIIDSSNNLSDEIFFSLEEDYD